MAMGEPASHNAQSSPPIDITEMLPAFASSALRTFDPGLPAVPKPGVTTASAAASARRLGVSMKRASRVAAPSEIRNARIRPSPSNQ